MSFDYSCLLGKIKERCKTQDTFAEQLGIGKGTLSAKLNNKTDFNASEIFRACEILCIPTKSIPEYFFCQKGS